MKSRSLITDIALLIVVSCNLLTGFKKPESAALSAVMLVFNAVAAALAVVNLVLTIRDRRKEG